MSASVKMPVIVAGFEWRDREEWKRKGRNLSMDSIVETVGSVIGDVTAVCVSIDRFPQNRSKNFVYLLIVLGPGIPA